MKEDGGWRVEGDVAWGGLLQAGGDGDADHGDGVRAGAGDEGNAGSVQQPRQVGVRPAARICRMCLERADAGEMLSRGRRRELLTLGGGGTGRWST